jgi:glutaredoxin
LNKKRLHQLLYIFYNHLDTKGEKIMKRLSVLFGLLFMCGANAADITMYYSPSCPHCHHARDFISNTLIYEYSELTLTMVNVTLPEHREMFQNAVKKCGFESGGVPVLVIGEKCEQGYADFMQDDLRRAVEADLTDEQKSVAAANKKALELDAEKFKSENASRAQSIIEYSVSDSGEKKNDQSGGLNWRIVILVVLVAGLGYFLIRKDK